MRKSGPQTSIIRSWLNSSAFKRTPDPNRKFYTQLHPDITVEEPPRFAYGRPITVGGDADDPASWPRYVVAHLTHLKQEADPERPGENRIVYEVFVAKEGEWAGVELPEGLRGNEGGTDVV